jgi:hypothetical protein
LTFCHDGDNDDDASPFFVVREEFKDIVTTSSLFLCLCEKLSRRCIEEKGCVLPCDDSTEESTVRSNSKIDYSTPVGVINPEKVSKYTRTSFKKADVIPGRFDFIVTDPAEERKKNENRCVSEESFVMMFRTKRNSSTVNYDYACDAFFFESIYSAYASKCVFPMRYEDVFRSYLTPLPVVSSFSIVTKESLRRNASTSVVSPKRTHADAFPLKFHSTFDPNATKKRGYKRVKPK